MVGRRRWPLARLAVDLGGDDAFRDIHGPGYYFHIGLDECFIGSGIWHPDPPTATV